MRKPHAKHGKKRHRGTYPGDATVILHRAGITTREVEDQTRTWDCIGQVCSVFRRLSDANHFMLRRPILPVDPLDGMSRAVRAHCFADRREEGLFAEAREEPEALRVLSAGVHDFRGRMLIRSSPSATDPCPSKGLRFPSQSQSFWLSSSSFAQPTHSGQSARICMAISRRASPFPRHIRGGTLAAAGLLHTQKTRDRFSGNFLPPAEEART